MFPHEAHFTYFKRLTVGLLYFPNGVKTTTDHFSTLGPKKRLLLLKTANLRLYVKESLELSLLLGLGITEVRVRLSLVTKELANTI